MDWRAMAAVIAAMAPGLALAAEPVEVRYDVFWGGFRAAEARLASTGAKAELTAHATGLADSLSAFALEADAGQGRFHTHSQSKSMESRLAVDFHGQPHTLVDEIRRAEPDDGVPRPPVPEAQKAGTLDPLSAILAASARALSAPRGDRFTLAVFDGRNRYDATVTVQGPATQDVSGRRIAGIRAKVEIKPLAGFRAKSKELWDDSSFTVLIDPTTALPARITSDGFAVATVISAVGTQQLSLSHPVREGG